jgi:flagellar biosynthesis anti-sigma factor FlgM
VPDSQTTDRAGTNGANQATKPLQTGPQSSADQTNPSPNATQLSNLSATLSNVPEIRQDRVDAVRRALKSGNYSVSNQQIAHSMLRDFRMNSTSSK